MLLKKFLGTVLVWGILPAVCCCAVIPSCLELSPGNFFDVELPFAYQHLSHSDVCEATFVFERAYTVLQDGLKFHQTALVGPLRPCIFIGLRNEENGKAVIFHRHYSSLLASLIAIAKRELAVHNPQSVRGILFTNKTSLYEVQWQDCGGHSMRDLHNGKTPEEDLIAIRDALMAAFGMQDCRHIETIISNARADNLLGDYEFAELTVFVDSKLNLKNTCLMHEHIFGDFDIKPLDERIDAVITALDEQRQLFINDYFEHVPENDLNTYNMVPFVRV